MAMALAMIFGAHLLPYGWLYQSKSYMVLSVVIPVAVLLVGLNFPAALVAGFMIAVEIVFSLLLIVEVKKLPVP
jgi:fumarate reductase subunit D